MPWLKLDDHLHGHPKVARAGLEAMGLWVRSLSYAGAYLTDGFVPRETVLGFCGDAVTADRATARLVAAGLWEAVDGGYQIHEYTTWQTPAAAVKAQREDERRKKQAQREKAKRGDDGRYMSPRLSPGDTAGDSRGESHRTDPTPTPSPTPNPIPSEIEKQRASESPASGDTRPPQQQRSAPPSAPQLRLEVTEPERRKRDSHRSEVNQLGEAFRERWKRARSANGNVYAMTPADWKAARQLVTTYGLEKAIALVDRFIADGDRWVTQRGHLLRDLAVRVNAYHSNGATTPHAPLGSAPVARFEKGGLRT